MSLSQLRNVNFGRSKSGATGPMGVGYQLLDTSGSPTASRTTAGVYQTAPGIYAAYISFPDNFRGQILWDTGSAFATTFYATEQYNYEENNQKVDEIYNVVTSMTGTLNSIYDIQYGRWRIVNDQMIFYREDNSTEVARFNLFDDAGNPTMDAVFERVKV
jgi:hypothetical protein